MNKFRRLITVIVCFSLFVGVLSSCSSSVTKIELVKNPQMKADVTLIEAFDEKTFPYIDGIAPQLKAKNARNISCSIQFENNEVVLYEGSKATKFDNISDYTSVRIFGTQDGFDDLYLVADDYLYKCNSESWDCLLSFAENLILTANECFNMYYDDGIVILGGYGTSFSEATMGNYKLTLKERPSDEKTISILKIGPFYGDDMWIEESVLLFNATNDDISITLNSYNELDFELLMELMTELSPDIILSSECNLTMLLDSDCLREIDYSRISDEVNHNVLEASNGYFITPFFAINCVSCKSSDPILIDTEILYEDLINPNGHIVRHDSFSMMLNLLYPLIDYDNLTTNQMTELFCFCEEHKTNNYVEDMTTYSNISSGEVRFLEYHHPIGLGSIFQYITLCEYYDGDMALIDLGAGGYPRLRSDTFITLPNGNENKDGSIYYFLNTLLSYDYQRLNLNALINSIPINTAVMNEISEEAIRIYEDTGFIYDGMEWMYLLGERVAFDFREASDIEASIIYSGDYDNSLNQINPFVIPETEADEFIDYINNASGFYIKDPVIHDVIIEEGYNYREGIHTLEEASAIASDRILTYRQELE